MVMNLYLLILLPLLAALVAALMPSERYRPLLLPATSLVQLILVLRELAVPSLAAPYGMLYLDALGRLILLVVSLLYAAVAVYAIGYFRSHPTWSNRIFTVCLLIFPGAMSMAAAAQHLERVFRHRGPVFRVY